MSSFWAPLTCPSVGGISLLLRLHYNSDRSGKSLGRVNKRYNHMYLVNLLSTSSGRLLYRVFKNNIDTKDNTINSIAREQWDSFKEAASDAPFPGVNSFSRYIPTSTAGSICIWKCINYFNRQGSSIALAKINRHHIRSFFFVCTDKSWIAVSPPVLENLKRKEKNNPARGFHYWNKQNTIFEKKQQQTFTIFFRNIVGIFGEATCLFGNKSLILSLSLIGTRRFAKYSSIARITQKMGN